MPVVDLKHFNIAAPPELLQQILTFYCDVIGLTVGERPPFDSDGYWLYAAGQPLVHLVRVTDQDQRLAQVRTTLDHIAFGCSDYQRMRARLDELQVRYVSRHVPLTQQRQLFLADPAGNGVELIFSDAACD